MKNVVVISAHPDDEVLGAAGTLLKHKAKGDKVFWIIVTNISIEHGYSEQKVNERQREINEVANRLGISKVTKLDYPTMTITDGSLLKLIPEISKIFQEIKPEIVYCMNRSDAHSDHRYIFEAVVACTKSFRYPYIKRLLMYECISETEFAPALPERVFIPNYFVDISEFILEKLDIMKIYLSEIGDHPFPRSLDNIKALAHFRGASVGVQYAEAFQLLKFIDK